MIHLPIHTSCENICDNEFISENANCVIYFAQLDTLTRRVYFAENADQLRDEAIRFTQNCLRYELTSNVLVTHTIH